MDMEDFLTIQRRQPAMPDGTEPLRLPHAAVSRASGGSRIHRGAHAAHKAAGSHEAADAAAPQRRRADGIEQSLHEDTGASLNAVLTEEDAMAATSSAATRGAGAASASGADEVAEAHGRLRDASSDAWGSSLEDADWAGSAADRARAAGPSHRRPQGLSIEFENVSFGYTSERQVRLGCLRYVCIVAAAGALACHKIRCSFLAWFVAIID